MLEIISKLVLGSIFLGMFISAKRSIDGDKKANVTIGEIKKDEYNQYLYEVSFIDYRGELINCTTVPYENYVDDLVGRQMECGYCYRNDYGPFVHIKDKRLKRCDRINSFFINALLI